MIVNEPMMQRLLEAVGIGVTDVKTWWQELDLSSVIEIGELVEGMDECGEKTYSAIIQFSFMDQPDECSFADDEDYGRFVDACINRQCEIKEA